MANFKWTEEKVREEIARVATRSELHKTKAYEYIVKYGLQSVVDARFNDRRRFTPELAIELAKKYSSRTEIRLTDHYLYEYLKRKGLLEAAQPPKRIDAINDGIIDDLINDPHSRIEEDGSIYTQRNRQWRMVKGNTEWRAVRPYFKNNKSGSGQGGYEIAVTYGYKTRVRINFARVMYKKFVGPLGQDEMVMFTDGNPANIKPSNLFKSDMATAWSIIGKTAHALNLNPRQKLTQEQAEAIREDRAQGAKFDTLVKKYGVCKSTVSYIVNKKTWR